MRIGLAVGYFDPQVGGSEEVVKRLASGFVASGHDVLVATSRHPAREPSRMVAPVAEFALSGNAVNGVTGDVLAYQEFLRGSDRDVWLFYAAQIWSTDLALPVLDTLRASVVVPCGYSGLRLPAYADYFRRLPGQLRRADALVYMSTNYQDWETDQAAGLGPSMTVIPNAASDDEFETLAVREAGGDGGRLVITVANHLPDKGHDAVIAAFQQAAGPQDRLVIIGSRLAPRRESPDWIRCKIAAFRDRRITLAEGISRQEVVRLYKQADVFLFGSRVECAPLVLIEAMAAGLPFVTTAAGNARDYADAGIVGSESDLAEGLRRLLADPDLRRRFGAVGRARWESTHRWSSVVAEYEELFERVVAARAGARTP